MAQPVIASRVLSEIARQFQRTRAARIGGTMRSRSMDYEDLLKACGCEDGDERKLAEYDLVKAEREGLLQITRHRRTGLCQQVRIIPEKERELFALIGGVAPSLIRSEIQILFERAKTYSVPENERVEWMNFCKKLDEDLATGRSIAPFDRGNLVEIDEILNLLAALLSWKGESLLRFASSLLCGDSKRLEELQGRLETCLSRITHGAISSFVDLGILANERSVWLHGPLKLMLHDGEINLGLLQGPARLSMSDLMRGKLMTGATHFLTVENQAMFHELCKSRSGIILASSGSEGGFAHSAIIHVLRQIPVAIECGHFGDSDPKGFEILANLRERSERRITSLHMNYRPDPKSNELTKEDYKLLKKLSDSMFLTHHEKQELHIMVENKRKGAFEQESLGLPLPAWPFYQ